MSEVDALQTENSSLLQEILEPYFAKYHREKCYLGLFFNQGGREMVQINVPAHDLPILLQAQPATGNDPDSGKNRPEVKGHTDEVKDYLLKRITRNQPWILGTLTANIDPEKIKIIKLSRGICIVVIPRGVKLDITDGQHRKRAVHELIEARDGELVGENDFPITIVLEDSFEQCQIDFRDMAKTKALDKSLLLSFGEFEGRVGIVKRLIQSVAMFYGKTEKIKNSPATKHKLIYTTNYIAKLVGCTFANNSESELTDLDVEKASAALSACLNEFFVCCDSTRHIAQSRVEDLSVDEIDSFKKNNLLGTSIGLQILGSLLYCTYDRKTNCFDSEKVLRLAQIDWLKKGQLWQNNVVVSDFSNPKNPYKIATGINSKNIALNRVKEELGWFN